MANTKRTNRSAVPARSTRPVAPPAASPDQLLGDIRALIEAARQQVARTVDTTLVALYWHVGKRIRENVLANDRAEYGRQILQTLSKKLAAEYGRGYSQTNLSWMTRFAEVFPKEDIVAALSQQLSWSHFVQIIPLDNPLKREFYAELCRIERWSTRTLRHKIDHLLFERTAVAKKPEKLIEKDIAALRDEDRLTPDMVFRDPYFLDFLGLTGQYAEKDLEQAVLRELEAFILELGTDFAFVARQKRMTVDGEDPAKSGAGAIEARIERPPGSSDMVHWRRNFIKSPKRRTTSHAPDARTRVERSPGTHSPLVADTADHAGATRFGKP